MHKFIMCILMSLYGYFLGTDVWDSKFAGIDSPCMRASSFRSVFGINNERISRLESR